MNDEIISLRQFAKLAGVSLAAIQKAIDMGRIPENCVVQTERGRKLFKDAALKAWSEVHDDGTPSDIESPSWGKEKTKQEALLARARREALELQLAEIRGELHHAEDVKKLMTEANARIKASLLKLPTQCAKIISSLPTNDYNTVLSVLDEYIRETLLELSEYDPAAIERERKRRTNK